MSKLYVVATPIGNLGDITGRALETLGEVDVVLCEDTRRTRKLLSHFDIHTPTESFHANSKDKKIRWVVDTLRAGEDIAYVTDAGTPTISDPGPRLVSTIREEIGDEVDIVAIPGPSALTAALSISGLPASDFLFLGFLPRKKGRRTLFEEIAQSERTVVFYESPHRIMKTLRTLNDMLESNREVVVGREITKVHEEVATGTAVEVLEYFENNEEKQQGEFVVMVAGK